MKQPSVILGVLIIVNACMWGFTLIMVARALSGTGMYQEIQPILGGMAGMSTVIIGGGMAGLVASMRSKESETKEK